MRILTVVLNLGKGGTQRAAQSFAEGYAILGHDSRILALYGLGPRYDELKESIPVWNALNSENVKAIEAWNPEIIHLHSHGPKKEDVEKIVHLCNRSKIIETNVFSRPSPWADLVDISFQLSEWAQWLFNLRGGIKLNSVIVPNPINCNAFKRASFKDITEFKKEHSIPEKAYVIGRIGQALKAKWSTHLLDAFNEVSRKVPHTYLLLINPPENILEEANRSPFKNNIVHIPKIFGDQNLSIAYSAMDVMLLIADIGESFGIVSTESILCGTPVVALSTPWGDNSQVEVVGNFKGGYVVNHKKNLSKVIIDLYENRIKYIPELGIKHVQKYEHTKVAEKAIQYTISVGKKTQYKNTKKVLSILKQSIDKPRLLTLIFIGLNNNFFRLLTIYSSGYKDKKEMRRSISAFFIRKYLK